MKKVEIYDQYSNIYADSLNNGDLGMVDLGFGQQLDTSRYTLVHAGSGFTTVEGINLEEGDANLLVESLYNNSKTLGSVYTDKIIKLDQGYAELVISFPDGKRLNRVIYTVDQ